MQPAGWTPCGPRWVVFKKLLVPDTDCCVGVLVVVDQRPPRDHPCEVVRFLELLAKQVSVYFM